MAAVHPAFAVHKDDTAFLYESICRDVDYIHENERLRRSQLEQLILRDQCDSLRHALRDRDDVEDDLRRKHECLQEELRATTGNMETSITHLRTKRREIDTLKAELESLQSADANSNALLKDKLALTREISALKPEVEHLRSQVASQQEMYSEKLSLQRQLDATRVELENEKAYQQKGAAPSDLARGENASLLRRTETLNSELIAERHLKEKAETEMRKSAAIWAKRVESLETQLDKLERELKSARIHGDTQNNDSTSHKSVQPRAAGGRSKPNSKSRPAARVESAPTLASPIWTPEAKKVKTGQSMMGEKSLFSMTPFLKRPLDTMSTNVPTLRLGTEEGKLDIPMAAPAMPDGTDLEAVILSSAPGQTNASSLDDGAKTAVSSQPLPDSGPENENSATQEVVQKNPLSRPRPRKRLGLGIGSTIFNENEGENEGANAQTLKIPNRTTSLLGRQKLSAAKSTFGAISPRKRARPT